MSTSLLSLIGRTCPNLHTGFLSSVRIPFSICLQCFGGWHDTTRLICKSPTVACGELPPATTPILRQLFNGMFLFWMATIGWRFRTLVRAPNHFLAFATLPYGGSFGGAALMQCSATPAT